MDLGSVISSFFSKKVRLPNAQSEDSAASCSGTHSEQPLAIRSARVRALPVSSCSKTFSYGAFLAVRPATRGFAHCPYPDAPNNKTKTLVTSLGLMLVPKYPHFVQRCTEFLSDCPCVDAIPAKRVFVCRRLNMSQNSKQESYKQDITPSRQTQISYFTSMATLGEIEVHQWPSMG